MLHAGTVAHGGEILLLDSALAFEAGSKRAARRKRDEAIPDAAEFDADTRLCITLAFGGKKQWQARRGGKWVDICVAETDAGEG